MPSKALFLFFGSPAIEFYTCPKSGKTMRYRVESCFIRFGTPNLPPMDLNRFLNKCNPEEVTSKRWKKVELLPDFSRFCSEFFFVFSWAFCMKIFRGYKNYTVFIFDGISKLCLRFSLGPHLHLFWKNFKNAFFSGRL